MSYSNDKDFGAGRAMRLTILAAVVTLLVVLPLGSCVMVYLVARG